MKVVVTEFAPKTPGLFIGKLKFTLSALWTWKLVLLFERSVQVTVQVAYADAAFTLAQLTTGAPGASGATVLFSLTLSEGVEPAPFLASTRYRLLVPEFTTRAEVKDSPVAVDWAGVRAIAALVSVQVVPLFIEVCTWKLVSFVEASVQAIVAWVAFMRVTVTWVGANGMARLRIAEAEEPVTFWDSTRR